MSVVKGFSRSYFTEMSRYYWEHGRSMYVFDVAPGELLGLLVFLCSKKLLLPYFTYYGIYALKLTKIPKPRTMIRTTMYTKTYTVHTYILPKY